MCVTDLYMLITYGGGSLLVVKLPGLELLDGFLHGDFSHFDSLLQRYELPLAGRFHPGIGVVHGGGGLRCRLSWTDGDRCFCGEGPTMSLLMSIKHRFFGNGNELLRV